MGMTRKLMSVSTVGLIDFRSDKERIARYTRQTRNAQRVAVVQNARMLDNQRERMAQAHVQVTGHDAGVPVYRDTPPRTPRRPITRVLTEDPHLEVPMWLMWLGAVLVCGMPAPVTLLGSLPFGVYLFLCRQRAAKARAQAEYDARYGAPEAETVAIPLAAMTGGRHAR